MVEIKQFIDTTEADFSGRAEVIIQRDLATLKTEIGVNERKRKVLSADIAKTYLQGKYDEVKNLNLSSREAWNRLVFGNEEGVDPKDGRSASLIASVQVLLKGMGKNVGKIGYWGPKTKAAVKEFQQEVNATAPEEQKIRVDGIPGKETLGKLLDIPIKSETETPLEAITEDTDIQAVYTEVEAAVKEQYDETKTNELIKKLEAIQTEDADKLAKRGELKKKLEGLKTVAKEGYTVLVDRIAKILSSADATTYPDATKRLEAVKAEIEKVKADLTNKELSFDTYEYYKGEVEKVTTLLNDTTKTDDEKLEALKQIFTIIESQNTTNTEVITDEDAIEQIYTGAKTALTSVFDKGTVDTLKEKMKNIDPNKQDQEKQRMLAQLEGFEEKMKEFNTFVGEITAIANSTDTSLDAVAKVNAIRVKLKTIEPTFEVYAHYKEMISTGLKIIELTELSKELQTAVVIENTELITNEDEIGQIYTDAETALKAEFNKENVDALIEKMKNIDPNKQDQEKQKMLAQLEGFEPKMGEFNTLVGEITAIVANDTDYPDEAAKVNAIIERLKAISTPSPFGDYAHYQEIITKGLGIKALSELPEEFKSAVVIETSTEEEEIVSENPEASEIRTGDFQITDIAEVKEEKVALKAGYEEKTETVDGVEKTFIKIGAKKYYKDALDGDGYNKSEDELFIGVFKGNARNGLGQEIRKSGNIYQGEYIEGNKVKGTLRWVDGDTYKGDIGGQGEGTFTFKKDEKSISYTGMRTIDIDDADGQSGFNKGRNTLNHLKQADGTFRKLATPLSMEALKTAENPESETLPEEKLTDIEVLNELNFDVRDYLTRDKDGNRIRKNGIEEKKEFDDNGDETGKVYVEIKGKKFWKDIDEGLGYQFDGNYAWIGNFLNSKLNGTGEKYCVDMEGRQYYYKGQLKEDKYDGYGVFYGGYSYEGEWENGSMHGEGKRRRNNKVDPFKEGDAFEGTFAKEEFSKGTFSFEKDGETVSYTGEWNKSLEMTKIQIQNPNEEERTETPTVMIDIITPITIEELRLLKDPSQLETPFYDSLNHTFGMDIYIDLDEAALRTLLTDANITAPEGKKLEEMSKEELLALAKEKNVKPQRETLTIRGIEYPYYDKDAKLDEEGKEVNGLIAKELRDGVIFVGHCDKGVLQSGRLQTKDKQYIDVESFIDVTNPTFIGSIDFQNATYKGGLGFTMEGRIAPYGTGSIGKIENATWFGGYLDKWNEYGYAYYQSIDVSFVAQMKDTSYLTIRGELERWQRGEKPEIKNNQVKDRLGLTTIAYNPDANAKSLVISEKYHFPITLENGKIILSDFPDYKPNEQEPTIGQLVNLANIVSSIKATINEKGEVGGTWGPISHTGKLNYFETEGDNLEGEVADTFLEKKYLNNVSSVLGISAETFADMLNKYLKLGTYAEVTQPAEEVTTEAEEEE